MFQGINKQTKSYWYFHAAVNFKVIGLCWLLRIVGCYFSPSGTSSKISGLVDPSNTLHLNISPSPYCLPDHWHDIHTFPTQSYPVKKIYHPVHPWVKLVTIILFPNRKGTIIELDDNIKVTDQMREVVPLNIVLDSVSKLEVLGRRRRIRRRRRRIRGRSDRVCKLATSSL